MICMHLVARKLGYKTLSSNPNTYCGATSVAPNNCEKTEVRLIMPPHAASAGSNQARTGNPISVDQSQDQGTDQAHFSDQPPVWFSNKYTRTRRCGTLNYITGVSEIHSLVLCVAHYDLSLRDMDHWIGLALNSVTTNNFLLADHPEDDVHTRHILHDHSSLYLMVLI
jgi:hypothetical protein